MDSLEFPREYTESRRRPGLHSAVGAILLALGVALGLKGLSVVIAGFGFFFLLGGLWGVLRIALGRNDRLVLSHAGLSYVDPVHPDRNKETPYENIAAVSLGDAKVGRMKEIQVTVEMKDGGKWTFGERFMDSAALQKFTEDLQEILRRQA